MTDEEKNKIENFMENAKDFGKEPPSRPLTDEEKKLASLSMGMNAAVIQFIIEGVIPHEEQLHFMMHVQDFTARLYAGEELRFDTVSQTLSINSVAGELYATAANEALINGHKNYNRIKELANEVRLAKTNNLDDDALSVPVDKPKYLN